MRRSPSCAARRILAVVVVVWFIPALANAHTFVGFDQDPAPCEFGEADSLVLGYFESDVEFVSAGAILNECSGLGFSGFSPPNVVAFDDNQTTASGQPATGGLGFIVHGLGMDFNRAQIDVSGSPGQTVTLHCGANFPFPPGYGAEASVILGTSPTTLELWTNQLYYTCTLSHTGVTLRVDNLRLSDQPLPSPIPIDTPVSTTLIALFIVLAGVLIIRNRVVWW